MAAPRDTRHFDELTEQDWQDCADHHNREFSPDKPIFTAENIRGFMQMAAELRVGTDRRYHIFKYPFPWTKQ